MMETITQLMAKLEQENTAQHRLDIETYQIISARIV